MDINESTILDFFDQIRQKTTDEWQDEIHVKIKLQEILRSQKGLHPTKTLSEQGLLRVNTKRLQQDISIENNRSTSASADFPADTPFELTSPLSPSFRTPAMGHAGIESFRIASPNLVFAEDEDESHDLPPEFGVTCLVFKNGPWLLETPPLKKEHLFIGPGGFCLTNLLCNLMSWYQC